MMITNIESFLSHIAVNGLLKRYKSNDYLVLDDSALQAAIDGSQPLSQIEWDALVNSPLTLRRLIVLATRAERNGVVRTDAANDEFWSGSHGLLLAADSGNVAPALSTENGWWRLVFLPAEKGWSVVLKLNADAPFRAALNDGKLAITVIDGRDQCVLSGILDGDGELQMPWPIAVDPYPYLMAAGGHFKVRPA